MSIKFAIAAATALGMAASASAMASIDFEDGTPGTPVGTFYAGDGVGFLNASFANTSGRTGGSGTVDIRSTSSGVFFGEDDAIVLNFSDNVTSFSIAALDVGSNGARAEGYDVSGTFLGADQFEGTTSSNDDDSFATLSLTLDGLREVRLFQPRTGNGSDGLVFDNLVFTLADAAPVPAPAALGLLGLGLLGLGAARRRK
ncbi:MAG: PEP-CTERM sorting domain-containing protein [Pacificimonas sp.]